MAYEPTKWVDGSTPALNAENLNKMESGIKAAHEAVDDIELKEGPAGPAGPAGPKGAKGAKGDDGFPTEEQWNALVARVEALEAPASE